MNLIKKILLSCMLIYSCALLPSAPASAASASSSSCAYDDENEKPVEQLTTREQIEYLFEPDSHSTKFAEKHYSDAVKRAAECCDNNQSLKQYLDARIKAKRAQNKNNKQADTYELFKKNSMSLAQLQAKAQEYKSTQYDTTNLRNEAFRLYKALPKEIWQKLLEYLSDSGLCRARLLALKLEQQESQNYIQTQKLKAQFAKQLQAQNEEIALLRTQLSQSSLQTSPPAYQHRFAAQASMQPHQGPAQLSIPIEQSSDQGAIQTTAHETGTIFFSPRTVEKALDAELLALADDKDEFRSVVEKNPHKFFNISELVESPRDRAKLLSKKNAFIQKLHTSHSSKK